MLSTPEEHAALALEILSEMTPEQLREALKPIDFEAEISKCRIEFEPEPSRHNLWLKYAPIMAIRPEIPFVIC